MLLRVIPDAYHRYSGLRRVHSLQSGGKYLFGYDKVRIFIQVCEENHLEWGEPGEGGMAVPGESWPV